MSLKIAAVFSDNMVLQRNKPITVWGSSDSDTVSVSLNGVKSTSKTLNGQWKCVLPPMPASGPFTITVSDKASVVSFSNVMIGEVWLAGGQSNMEFEIRDCIGGQDCLKNDCPNVRFYYTQKKEFIDEDFLDSEAKTCWELFSPDKAVRWSAVGYFFAKQLSEKLGCTVGIIGCNWGGTSASTWMSKEFLTKSTDTLVYQSDYEKAIDGKSIEEQDADYGNYLVYQNKFDKLVAEYYSTPRENPTWDECVQYAENIIGKSKWDWAGPMCRKNRLRPCGLYETMVSRVCPYTINGFIYYQGESDDHHPKAYYSLFSNLIAQWRHDWGDYRLPFIFVQLPMFSRYGDAEGNAWAYIRECQDKVSKTVANTWMAVILEHGEKDDIHPKNKKPVGERLAALALKNVYSFNDINPYAPEFAYAIPHDDSLELHFNHADDGFDVLPEADGFEIAGNDMHFHPCNIKIEDNVIFLSSEEVKYPVYVKYLFKNYAEVKIFSKRGLPLAPFRNYID